MPSNRLRVRVMGYVGSGKTTLIEALTRYLRAQGILFHVRGEENEEPAGTLAQRTEALRERETLVEIESVMVRPPFRSNPTMEPNNGRPFRSFILGKDRWWHPVDEDGKVYESMRYDAEATLSGYLPGVTIHIHSPEGT